MRDSHEPVLKDVADGGVQVLEQDIALHAACLGRLEELIRAAGALEDIVVVSGYRTMEEQKAIYEGSLAENGPAFTANYVAWPGCSEHQTGLAVDVGEIVEGEPDFIAPSFPDHGACGAFKKLAASYGFVQRYKEGKEALTGIACEPWHFRYVGVPHAACMESLDMCLEEYVAHMRGFSYEGRRLAHAGDGWRAESYYVAANSLGDTDVRIPACEAYEISGDNAGGFIVTAYYGAGHEI